MSISLSLNISPEIVDIFDIQTCQNKNKSMSTKEKENFQFIYNGVEYDATEYAEKHPGGLSFLKNMKEMTKDFTEYFRALHSDSAEKVLKSFPIIAIGKPTQSSQQYMEIYKKVQSFYEPIWIIEILLISLVAVVWMIGCTTEHSWLSIVSFAFAQILIGWMSHSSVHSRNPTLNFIGRCESTMIGGLSPQWWNQKHNMHHMFTNIIKYDEDIQHEYKVYLYEFLYLKWRFDSLMTVIKSRNYFDCALIILNYCSIIYWHHNILNWLIAQLLSGFYSAFVLIGNHERQKTYAENPRMPFIDHQIVTSRNYREEGLFWLLMMGGMQYQAEHHLFPQIPFYRLPTAKKVIIQELDRLKKSLIYGPVI